MEFKLKDLAILKNGKIVKPTDQDEIPVFGSNGIIGYTGKPLFNSKMIITGDVTQIDLPRGVESGLIKALRILKGVKGISFVELTALDVVRHPVVQRIIERYEGKYE